VARDEKSVNYLWDEQKLPSLRNAKVKAWIIKLCTENMKARQIYDLHRKTVINFIEFFTSTRAIFTANVTLQIIHIFRGRHIDCAWMAIEIEICRWYSMVTLTSVLEMVRLSHDLICWRRFVGCLVDGRVWWTFWDCLKGREANLEHMSGQGRLNYREVWEKDLWILGTLELKYIILAFLRS
jgi:hypothetical protein